MFSKSYKNPIEDTSKRSRPTIISSDLAIQGNLIGGGEVHVDGRIEGDIKCRSIILGVNGSIEGSVTAEDARIFGLLRGKLGANKVFLGSTAKVNGDITHASIAIEPGAFLEGHCRHIGDPIVAEQGPEDLMITDARDAKDKGKDKDKKDSGQNGKK